MMDNRPSDLLKPIATELSDLIVSEEIDIERKESLMERLAYPPPPHPRYAAPPPAPGPHIKETTVGIWTQVNKDGKKYFRRDPRMQREWRFWANVHEIKPKENKKRILLLGESAARGFLYDPYYNVAGELQAILNKIPAAPATEVIDLARTSMLFNGLLDLTRSSVILEPDAVVIFAGNNWVYAVSDEPYDYKELYDLYLRESFAGIKSFLENELKKKVLHYCKLVSGWFVKKGIPVIFVIPEFNLKDWKSHDAERILPWAPGDRISKWLEARDMAGSALLRNDIEKAGSAAEAMIELDSSNPLGFEWLAEYCLRTGQRENAIRWLEKARDTILFNRSSCSMPRCITAIQEAILKGSANEGLTIVDLPEIFRKNKPTGIPDRTLFLDNCHLTVEGIKTAMRHTAKALRQVLYGQRPAMEDIPDSGLVPDRQVQAIAHFCAAIYATHYGQTSDLIQYHCNKAVAGWPGIRDTMYKYLDFSTRKVPTPLCRSFEELIVKGEMLQYEGGLALRHPRNTKLMDTMLNKAITNALHPWDNHIEQDVAALRMEEHGLGPARPKVDLLESYYSKTSYHEFNSSARPGFYQARSTRSLFQFVSGDELPLRFNMVYRSLNGGETGQKIQIFLNDHPDALAELPPDRTWKTAGFTAGKNLLLKGVNTLLLVWPYVSAQPTMRGLFTGDTFLRAVFPSTGEIFSLEVTF